ncbi:hypothetical protein SAMN03159353_1008177 [Cedecea sp. NFIX57]|nr:hypothetical protein SAMN03159353_1008177 [Cedecea sp. NFIX57]
MTLKKMLMIAVIGGCLIGGCIIYYYLYSQLTTLRDTHYYEEAADWSG